MTIEDRNGAGRRPDAALDEEAWLALPWRVNGTLEPHELPAVERALEHSAAFRAEERLLDAFAHEVRAAPSMETAMDRGFLALKARIGRAGGGASRRPGPWIGAIRGWREALRATPARIRGILGAQAVAVAAAVLLIVTWPSIDPGPNTYRMATDAAAVPDGPLLRLRMVDGVSEADLRDVLRTSGLVIVDGPTETGLYTVDGRGGTIADPAALAARLGERPEVALAVVTR